MDNGEKTPKTAHLGHFLARFRDTTRRVWARFSHPFVQHRPPNAPDALRGFLDHFCS